jgi:hypothetical protein
MMRMTHRLFDERAPSLGPYYLSFPHQAPARDRNPEPFLQYGLEQYGRWRRSGDVNARERFLAHAIWARNAQRCVDGVDGSYPVPEACRRYGCDAGFRSARVQGYAVSLLLRAHELTGSPGFLQSAAQAAIPFSVDAREGGVAWHEGNHVFLEGRSGPVPSHILGDWLVGMLGLLEISRMLRAAPLAALFERSEITLETYLPCYDSGRWSYESLLAAPSGFRRQAPPHLHRQHLAALDVLFSITRNELFATVARRWRRYLGSFESRVDHLLNAAVAVPNALVSDILTIRGGAYSII